MNRRSTTSRASRSDGQQAQNQYRSRTANSNPFGNDDHDDSNSNNPFGDDSSDFRRRGGGGSNPFESNGGGSNPFGDHHPNSRTKESGSSNNPFGDPSEDTRKTPRSSPKPSRQVKAIVSNANPFDDASSSSASNNPFGDAPSETFSPRRPKGISSPSHDADSADNSNNPFDSDAGLPSKNHGRNQSSNFAAQARRQSRAVNNIFLGFNKKKGPDDDSSHLDGVDENDDDISYSSASSPTRGRRHRRPQTEMPSSSSTSTTARSSTSSNASSSIPPNSSISSETPTMAGNLKAWLRGNKPSDDTDAYAGTASHPSSYSSGSATNAGDASRFVPTLGRRVARNFGKAKGKFAVQQWPYDDYHEEQQKYYETFIDTQKQSAPKSAHTNVNDDDGLGGYASGSDDEKKDDRTSTSNAAAASFERPDELPSIQEAVQGLSLVDFEKKAQDRAISIIGAWLFDAGLIDELLVNGAVKHISTSSAKTSILGSEGFLKMDKEIEKLRASAQHELSLINSRLNDGVAASGTEVQELVNAVATTKSDLSHLRQLTAYISDGYRLAGRQTNGDNGASRSEFLLANFPRLKAAIHARRNFFRCFRELEFFSQIPATCERLREELHSGEWTADEWNTIRNVCMEHVELEILLVEAEVGMKARMDSGEEEFGSGRKQRMKRFASSARRQGRSSFSLPGGRGIGNFEMVDKFLSPHVKNVWELGDEIRMRILSGIGSAFELASNNPAGMVALVEAVEVYERASQQYKALHKEEDEEFHRNRTLNFTDMRAASLAQIYQDFELRGLEIFREIHQAADIVSDDDIEARTSQFTAVLRAATELVAEIDRVKNDMAPCFPPHWAVEVIWSSCVAHVCSNQILQQIGGPDGQNLPGLTVTQLLDLVAWVEFFRETVEESFPVVAQMHSKKTYFDTRPDLFSGEGKKEVDMDSATDSLAWVNNMLWEVHRLAQEEFLVRTRTQTDEWLTKVYGVEHAKNMSSEGRLTTSLCEDIFSLASVQLRTIRERLTRKSDALIMAVCLVFSMLRSKQIHSRDEFLQDLETCCAASNDFQRMSERCEEVMQELLDECDFPPESVNTLESSSSELLALYSSDAVYAAQSTHIYVFEPITEAIGDQLFSSEWETDLTQNELALTITRTLEDFMTDLEQFMDDFMLKKAVDSLISRSVVFYLRRLLLKAETHNSNKVSCFSDNAKALERMSGDIRIMREYFDGLAPQFRALDKVIENEFKILTTVHECMSIAAEISDSDAADFILVLHKRLKDIDITKHVVSDLWHLVNPTQERSVWELVESMEAELVAMAPNDQSRVSSAHDRMQVPGLRLDEMMANLYVESKRRRPVKAGAMEKMVMNWRKNWKLDDAGGQYEG